MEWCMKNDLLDYYKKYNISPERQDIADLSVHYARRKKLYRQCGIPEVAFRNAEILEVGPGGGHNTLAFFHWKCKHVDLVEANPQGIKDMRALFSEEGIAEEQYSIFECLIEEYSTERKYDIVIAEGFLPTLSNQEEVTNKLKQLTNENGIVVVTCVDKVGFFVERIKKLVGRILTQNIEDYQEKVKYLTDIFQPQLKKLRGVSKIPEDWVKDNILVPTIDYGQEFSLSRAMQYFEDDFEILGTSPQMFTDYSWNKDIWYDYKKDYLEQFDRKRLSFLLANMPEIILPLNVANILAKCFMDINNAEAEYEETLDLSKVSYILECMGSVEKLVQQNFNDEFIKVFAEIETLLTCLMAGLNIDMGDYPHFFGAFGRTQQYISFVRK